VCLWVCVCVCVCLCVCAFDVNLGYNTCTSFYVFLSISANTVSTSLPAFHVSHDCMIQQCCNEI